MTIKDQPMTDTEFKAAIDAYAKEKRQLERDNAELRRLLSRVIEMVPHDSLTLFGDQMALGQARRACERADVEAEGLPIG